MKLLALALSLALICVSPRAEAGEARFDADLRDAIQRLDASRGPEVYAALRRVWSTWDRADPLAVEEALRAAAASPRLSPPARAYAALLVAYARSRRGDLDDARARVRALGYVGDWAVIGPFDNEGKTGLDAERGPELDFDKAIVPGRAYSGKERPVRWRTLPAEAFPLGFVDSSALIRPEQRICVLSTTWVSARKGTTLPRAVSAWVGASGAFKLFWNGRPVLTEKAYRGYDADRQAALLTLEPGANALTLKVCGDDAAPVFSVRLADARGAPDPGLETTAELGASAEAAKLATGKQPAKPTAPALEGPLQAFQRLVAAREPPAATLEAYARYLDATDGDDASEHESRDFARRAAEREPSIERLLFAGQLSEDRNQQMEWVGKAAARVGRATSQRDRVAVLLARAALARSGPNPQEASPLYDEVLALDPDDLPALVGRVELYNQAGLRRTALAALERALERAPHSVSLLNMTASELRALGRTTEAAEVEARYAALRFDDRSYLDGMITLAIARRDARAAERWVDRLLAADPSSQWAIGVAARAYRALGQPERAIAAYRRALTLAPEDTATLRWLADLEGELGHRDEQLALLRKILELHPQDQEVREYVEHIEPPKPRADEAYAWEPDRFLKQRTAPAAGQNRRTLRDLTVSTVYANGLSSSFRQVVFQPLTDAAAALGRQYAFQYQADRQVVQLRGARVFRADGRVDEAIESGEGAADDPSIAMYTSARTFYVQFPRLEPGDVVELRYRVDDTVPNNEFASYFGDVEYLQSSEPVLSAEYVVIAPKSRRLYVDARVPGLKREVVERGDQRIYRFAASDIPPIAPEPAMPPWPEVLGFVEVSTYPTWRELGQWYWGLAKDQFDLDDETRKLAHDLVKGKTTELDKVKAVYGWVVKNTRYVALELGIYGFKPRRCVQTVARGWGDCKDKATVIVSLLRELGIPSTIVIVRTQLRGEFPSKVASLAPFDHAIAYVPSLDLYLDGTAEYAGATELPKMDLGALALRINEGDPELVHLPEPDPAKNVVERRVLASVSASGDAELELDYETRGTAAAEWRRRYHAEATRRERVASDLGREFPGFDVQAGATGLGANDLEDLEQPVRLKVRGTTRSFARREGKNLSMSVTTNTRLTPAYASLSRRSLDVRLLAFSTIDDTFTVKPPPGMRVVSAPPEAKVDTRFGSYSLEVTRQSGAVVVRSRLSLKVTRVKPSDYEAWKQFCSDADQALDARLVVGP